MRQDTTFQESLQSISKKKERALIMKKIITVETPARRKMNTEELQMYMHFKKRGFSIPPKKGKGSYDRKRGKKCVA